MIISMINSKGGTGKTTSAIYLACALHRAGHHPIVIDLDPQGSASDWADRATETGQPLPFAVEDSNLRRLDRIITAAGDGAVIILDTPPGDPATIDAAIKAADFAVVPAQASAIEIARVWETIRSIESIPHGVLITSARLGTRNLEEVVDALEARDVGVFRARIPIRERIRDAFGTYPTRDEGYGSVAEEILEALR